MSLEHSPARQRKSGSATFPYELLTRDELAARLHCTPTTVTRSYARWGLRPVKIAGRILFPSDQVAALERRAIDEEVK
jgi:hypothetical protein